MSLWLCCYVVMSLVWTRPYFTLPSLNWGILSQACDNQILLHLILKGAITVHHQQLKNKFNFIYVYSVMVTFYYEIDDHFLLLQAQS